MACGVVAVLFAAFAVRLHHVQHIERLAGDIGATLPAQPSRSTRSTARRSACSTGWSTTSPRKRRRVNLAIASREGAANYRVRGYLAAQVIRGRTHISWVWDVYDDDKLRTLRITGEEASGRSGGDPWSAADEAMLRRIARTSMDRLAAYAAQSGRRRPTPATGSRSRPIAGSPGPAVPRSAARPSAAERLALSAVPAKALRNIALTG